MDVYRTPDERFADLPGYDFAPQYVDVPAGDGDGATLRVHYLDEGPRDAAPVLLMHGEPSWSYLYRKMIPVLVSAGLRCIAPDLVGFGRSDKPTVRSDYTYQRHVDWMTSVLEQLDLQDVTFVGQDWGGLIGLRLVTAMPDRFARVVAANTFLPTGDAGAGEAFLRWQRFSQDVEDFAVGFIVATGCATELPPEVVAAYDAPFPDDRAKAGARQFPMLVPTSDTDPATEPNRRAWDVLRQWKKPFLTAFSDQDAITRGGDGVFQREVPGCSGQAHTTIEGGGHFLQEDRGEVLAEVVADFVKATS
ncbi:MAG: alpha/beta fold hydrolase [Actinomycetia bacterium]|nr:alpha/beta fold hydrolase [Actinomycetes bacterium]